jgi:hypothetical protein
MDVDAGKLASTPTLQNTSVLNSKRGRRRGRSVSSGKSSKSSKSKSSSGSMSSESDGPEDVATKVVAEVIKKVELEAKPVVDPPAAMPESSAIAATIQQVKTEISELRKQELETDIPVCLKPEFGQKILDIANDLIAWEKDKSLTHSKLVRAGSRLVELGLQAEV